MSAETTSNRRIPQRFILTDLCNLAGSGLATLGGLACLPWSTPSLQLRYLRSCSCRPRKPHRIAGLAKSGRKGNGNVPDIGLLGNKLLHQLTALQIIQDNNLYSALSKIGVSAQESPVLADDYTGDAVQETGPRACVAEQIGHQYHIACRVVVSSPTYTCHRAKASCTWWPPCRRRRAGGPRSATSTSLPASASKALVWRTLTGQTSPTYVQNGVSFLYPHVVSAAEYLAIRPYESSSDLDPTARRASVSRPSLSSPRTHEEGDDGAWYRDASFSVRCLRLVERHRHSLGIIHLADRHKDR